MSGESNVPRVGPADQGALGLCHSAVDLMVAATQVVDERFGDILPLADDSRPTAIAMVAGMAAQLAVADEVRLGVETVLETLGYELEDDGPEHVAQVHKLPPVADPAPDPEPATEEEPADGPPEPGPEPSPAA